MQPDSIQSFIRDVHDFPKPGIIFKDITPLLENPKMVDRVLQELAAPYRKERIDAIAAIESRGFLFGFLLAKELGVPFIPVRKEGKLPYKKIRQEYSLEYGTAAMEMHEDAVHKGWRIVIHDDLLATGGTANAAGQLIQKLGGEVTGFSFIINLDFLGGFHLLSKAYNCGTHYLIRY